VFRRRTRGVFRVGPDGLRCARNYKHSLNHHRRHQLIHPRKHHEKGPLLQDAFPKEKDAAFEWRT